MLNIMRLGFIGLAMSATLSVSAYDSSEVRDDSYIEPAAQLALAALVYANKSDYTPVHYRSYRYNRYNRGYRRNSSRYYGYGRGYRKRGYYRGGRYYRGYNRGYYGRRY